MVRKGRRGEPIVSRRRLVGVLAASTLVGLASRARPQPVRARRIGWLWNQPPIDPADLREMTRLYLGPLGWTEGQNVAIEWRFTGGNANLLPGLAEELVQLKVELVVAEGTVVALAVKRVTSTIPIVVARSGDPVGTGLVASLARPGSNVTGTSVISSDLARKRFQVLHELLPAAKRVGELLVPMNPISRTERTEHQSLMNSLGMQPIFVDVGEAGQLDNAIAEAARRGAQVLYVSAEPLLGQNFAQIVRAAQKYSLPIMGDNSAYLKYGALISYGPDNDELQRQLAFVIDKVLRGTKPADLPVQQPSKFELGLNLKAARELGIAIPHSTLLLANTVIQ